MSIYGGTVTAYGAEHYESPFGGANTAAIGGNEGSRATGIKIYGGTVTAYAGPKAAAIGGGGTGSGSTKAGTGSYIYIYGGTVWAYGSEDGAAIGGGGYADGFNIYISGGEVHAMATNQYSGSAIGAGLSAEGSNIYISGGQVYAISHYVCAIGGKYSHDIHISAGDIIADSADSFETGTAIGTYGSDKGDVTPGIYISGGNIHAYGGNKGPGIGFKTRDGSGSIHIFGGTLEATGGNESAGIGGAYKSEISDIQITGGTVTATGGSDAAGIGGGKEGHASNINISGGASVTATGGSNGAGIGGGNGGNGSKISVSDGNVKSVGGSKGAGIGGGYNGTGGYITVSGGTVDATGGVEAAGIGGSYKSNGTEIAVSGGSVTATGGQYAAGIGGGKEGHASGVAISGGSVTATGGECGAGIGGGIKGYGMNIRVSGGSVTAKGGAEQGACIGGGDEGAASGIEITGGYVNAVHSNNGSAAIGGGRNRDCGNIIIRNCVIEAQGGYWAPAIGTGCNCPKNSTNSVSIENAIIKCYRGGGDGYPTIGLGPWANSGANCKVTIGDGCQLLNGSDGTLIAKGPADVTSQIGAIDVAITNGSITAKGITTTILGFDPSVSAADQERVSQMLSKLQINAGGGFLIMETQAKTIAYILECTDEQLVDLVIDPNINIGVSLNVQVKIVAVDFSNPNNPVIEYALNTIGTCDYYDAAKQMTIHKSRALDQSIFENAKGTLAVTLPVPDGVFPKAILHTSDDGEIIYDEFTENGDATFTRDAAAGTVTCTITHCSHLVSSFTTSLSTTDGEAHSVSSSPATGDAAPITAIVIMALIAAYMFAAISRRRA